MRSFSNANRLVSLTVLVLLVGGAMMLFPAEYLRAEEPACEKEAGFILLFDGKTAEGWQSYSDRGAPIRDDAWVVKDGAIESAGTNAFWYRYEAEQFDHFTLRLQFKLSQGANSGICLRSQKEGVPWRTGFEVQLLDDHGKEPDVHTTGAIYDLVCPMFSNSKPAGEWNDMEITCRGKLVTVVLNGLKVIDTDFSKMVEPLGKFKKWNIVYDKLPQKGYICFQDHGKPVFFRNIRIKKLEPPPATESATTCPETDFINLLDAEHLKDWAILSDNGKNPFTVKDNVIRCDGTWGPWFRYEKPLDDCVVRMEFRTTNEGVQKDGNSGIVLRSRKEGDPPYTGFEIQILADHGQQPMRHGTGAVYDIVTPMYNASRPTGEWNDLEITVDGLLCRIVLNGWKVIDTDFGKLTEPRGKFSFAYADMPRSGYLALQDHGAVVAWRNVRVKPIKH